MCHQNDKFEKIRSLDGITSQDLKNSLNVDENRRRVFKAGQNSGGASGSFFFFSHDNRFIIKTIGASEKKVLLGMLDDMIYHFEHTDNQSMLARIYGLYTIKTNIFGSLDLILMQNTSKTKSKDKLTFDLKGSFVNRNVVTSEKFWLKDLSFSRTLKDINFLTMSKSLKFPLVAIQLDVTIYLLNILKADTIFLSKHGLMDYSLLLTIENG